MFNALLVIVNNAGKIKLPNFIDLIVKGNFFVTFKKNIFRKNNRIFLLLSSHLYFLIKSKAILNPLKLDDDQLLLKSCSNFVRKDKDNLISLGPSKRLKKCNSSRDLNKDKIYKKAVILIISTDLRT